MTVFGGLFLEGTAFKSENGFGDRNGFKKFDDNLLSSSLFPSLAASDQLMLFATLVPMNGE
jgi:hypothetical protein